MLKILTTQPQLLIFCDLLSKSHITDILSEITHFTTEIIIYDYGLDLLRNILSFILYFFFVNFKM